MFWFIYLHDIRSEQRQASLNHLDHRVDCLNPFLPVFARELFNKVSDIFLILKFKGKRYKGGQKKETHLQWLLNWLFFKYLIMETLVYRRDIATGGRTLFIQKEICISFKTW